MCLYVWVYFRYLTTSSFYRMQNNFKKTYHTIQKETVPSDWYYEKRNCLYDNLMVLSNTMFFFTQYIILTNVSSHLPQLPSCSPSSFSPFLSLVIMYESSVPFMSSIFRSVPIIVNSVFSIQV